MVAHRTSCRMMLERLSAYLDGDLPAAECETIARHARRCPRCREVIAGLRQTTGLCRDAAERPLPSAVRQRAQASIRRLLEGPAPAARRRSRR